MGQNRYQNAAILIVDDDPNITAMLATLLRVEGYRCIYTTNSPLKAVELCREKVFDLLVLDITMPELDGFEVMEQIQPLKTNDYMPVLVLTSHTDRNMRYRALQLGATDFLTKPFDHLEVLPRIRNMLHVRMLQRKMSEQNEELGETVREREDELTETRLEIVRRLGRAVEYRDFETGDHIVRMSQYASVLARAVGMTDGDCDLLLHASPMHDIGKIAIPDCILQKPGKLDADEWSIMQSHTRIGAELLSGHDSDLMHMASTVALTHHEKWDGSGYPDGDKGDDIPLVGRIVALCDVFDALTSVRPYKPAWSVEAAIEQINVLSGTHFDPGLVKLFNRVLPDLLEIKDNNQNSVMRCA